MINLIAYTETKHTQKQKKCLIWSELSTTAFTCETEEWSKELFCGVKNRREEKRVALTFTQNNIAGIIFSLSLISSSFQSFLTILLPYSLPLPTSSSSAPCLRCFLLNAQVFEAKSVTFYQKAKISVIWLRQKWGLDKHVQVYFYLSLKRLKYGSLFQPFTFPPAVISNSPFLLTFTHLFSLPHSLAFTSSEQMEDYIMQSKLLFLPPWWLNQHPDLGSVYLGDVCVSSVFCQQVQSVTFEHLSWNYTRVLVYTSSPSWISLTKINV